MRQGHESGWGVNRQHRFLIVTSPSIVALFQGRIFSFLPFPIFRVKYPRPSSRNGTLQALRLHMPNINDGLSTSTLPRLSPVQGSATVMHEVQGNLQCVVLVLYRRQITRSKVSLLAGAHASALCLLVLTQNSFHARSISPLCSAGEVCCLGAVQDVCLVRRQRGSKSLGSTNGIYPEYVMLINYDFLCCHQLWLL